MRPRQAILLRVIAAGITLAFLLQPLASAQKSAPSPVMSVQPDAADPGTTRASEDQFPDSPSTVQARLKPPQGLAPGSFPAEKDQPSDTEPAATPPSGTSNTSNAQAADTPHTSTQTQQQQQTPHEPVGTAAAEAVQTAGVAASRPAGAALAPAKQRRARSILIKVGAVVGVGAAVATTWALSQGSPSRPPGAH